MVFLTFAKTEIGFRKNRLHSVMWAQLLDIKFTMHHENSTKFGLVVQCNLRRKENTQVKFKEAGSKKSVTSVAVNENALYFEFCLQNASI